jgi:hypothetical protein
VSRVVLLGPQRSHPILDSVLDSLSGPGGLDPQAPVALLSAGWQEREAEDDELASHLDREVVNLRLFAHSEVLFRRHPHLYQRMLERQDRLRQVQFLYRRRLAHALEATREMQRAAATEGGEGEMGDLARAELDDAIEAVRRLDAQHLGRVEEVIAGYDGDLGPEALAAIPELAEERQRAAEELDRCGAFLIAGGHVVVLLNRLSLYDLPGLLAGWRHAGPLVAWSGGAMVLSLRVVLFHDSPPQGAGNAELLAPGAGLVPRLLPLPHADRRLRLEDPARVSLLARRFAPALPVTLNDGARVDLEGGAPVWAEGVSVLEADGAVTPWEVGHAP